MRWLYHIVRDDGASASPQLAPEGFVHASYVDKVEESARLYFPADARLAVLQIDPRRLSAPLKVEATPRGPMPHIYGAIHDEAIRARLTISEMKSAPDKVQHTRIAFVAFPGMTLLDLVSVVDPVSRIASMGFDPTLACEVVSATEPLVHDAWKMHVIANAVRPALDAFDLVVVAGGIPARALVSDPAVVAWLAAFSSERTIASVCTGALLLGAAGKLRGKRATTHRSANDLLAEYGATYVDARVVDEGNVITAGGVTCGIDLGLHLVARLEDADVAAKIAAQMHFSKDD